MQAPSGAPDWLAAFTAAERPDLWAKARDTRLFEGLWPAYNHHGNHTGRYFGALFPDHGDLQILFTDRRSGRLVGRGRTIPFRWDGTLDDLPAGIDAVGLRAVDELDRPTALSALAAEVDADYQGGGLSGLLIAAMATVAPVPGDHRARIRLGGMDADGISRRRRVRVPRRPRPGHGQWQHQRRRRCLLGAEHLDAARPVTAPEIRRRGPMAPRAAPREVAGRLPLAPGVYRFRDGGGRVLYLGRATSLRRRVVSYWGNLGGRGHLTAMVRRIARVEAVVCDSAHEAAWLERNLLAASLPPWNRAPSGGQEVEVWISVSDSARTPGVAFEFAARLQSEIEALDWVTAEQKVTVASADAFDVCGWAEGELVRFAVRGGRLSGWTQRSCGAATANRHLSGTPQEWAGFAKRNAELAARLTAC